MREEVVIEVGGWEHECCGPAYERGERAQFTAFGRNARFEEFRHDEDRTHAVELRGRVSDLFVIADDGTRVPVLRIPSGRALRGFDEADDGHLETPWTGEPVEIDTGSFEVVLDRYTPGSAAGQ